MSILLLSRLCKGDVEFKTCAIDDMLKGSGETHLIITSGHRTKAHNARVGGVPNSWHLHKCGARDVLKSSLNSPKMFIKYVLKSGYRVIDYKRHIHVDVDEPNYLKGEYGKKQR